MTTDPYKDPRNEIEMQRKRRKSFKDINPKNITDLKQVTEIIDMFI
jgi:hypothetical protein